MSELLPAIRKSSRFRPESSLLGLTVVSSPKNNPELAMDGTVRDNNSIADVADQLTVLIKSKRLPSESTSLSRTVVSSPKTVMNW